MKSLPSGTSVMITGASSGIGRALALEYARRGAAISIAARRIDRLERLRDQLELLGCRALPLRCDVSRGEDLRAAVSATMTAFGRLDHVIANAGFAVGGTFARLEIEDFERQFATNVFGVLETVKAVHSELSRSHGRLAIIGSVAGVLGLPRTIPYSMSKFAIHGLADGLHHELQRDGITTTLIVPGFVDSEIRKVDNQGRFDAQRRETIPAWLRMPSDRAARLIVNAILKGKRCEVITAHGKILVLLIRHWPWLAHQLVGRFGVGGSSERGRKAVSG